MANLTNKEIDELKLTTENKIKTIAENTIEDGIAQKIGMIFYYHNKIEQSIEKLIQSLAPEIEQNILGLQFFNQKLSLLKSLTPNSFKLKLFLLLEKINSVRNDFAHKDHQNINYEKINPMLVNCYREAFTKETPQTFEKLKQVGKDGKITIPVKIFYCTSVEMELIVFLESMGKEKDLELKSFKALKNFSNANLNKLWKMNPCQQCGDF